MSKHTTRWEDGGMVGVYCYAGDSDQVLSEGEEPVPCAVCKTLISLKWNVRIIESPPHIAGRGSGG